MIGNSALVTGATGLLGRQVLRAFQSADWTVVGTGFSRADGSSIHKIDLSSEAEVIKAFDKFRPQVVVHCEIDKAYIHEPELMFPPTGAANRFPDQVDHDPDGARKINVEATRSLAKLCAGRSILLIYLSTDYVFSGKPGEAPYEADDTPRPTNLYGQTKLEGEKVALEEFKAAGKEGHGVVLRVPVLYGSATANAESAVNVLMDSVEKAQQDGAKIKMDHWALRYPTNTEDVGRVCHDLALLYLNARDRYPLPRVLHFSSEDRYTKYEICQLFGEIQGVPIDRIEANAEGNDPSASVQRPYDCHLSTRALKTLGIDVSTQDFVGWWRRECRAFRH